MDYGTIRIYERAIKAGVERWEIIKIPGSDTFLSCLISLNSKIDELNITHFLILDVFMDHLWNRYSDHYSDYYSSHYLKPLCVHRPSRGTLFGPLFRPHSLFIVRSQFSSTNLKFNLISCKCKYTNYHAVRYSLTVAPILHRLQFQHWEISTRSSSWRCDAQHHAAHKEVKGQTQERAESLSLTFFR